jgi:hypothetical protein
VTQSRVFSTHYKLELVSGAISHRVTCNSSVLWAGSFISHDLCAIEWWLHRDWHLRMNYVLRSCYEMLSRLWHLDLKENSRNAVHLGCDVWWARIVMMSRVYLRRESLLRAMTLWLIYVLIDVCLKRFRYCGNFTVVNWLWLRVLLAIWLWPQDRALSSFESETRGL